METSSLFTRSDYYYFSLTLINELLNQGSRKIFELIRSLDKDLLVSVAIFEIFNDNSEDYYCNPHHLELYNNSCLFIKESFDLVDPKILLMVSNIKDNKIRNSTSHKLDVLIKKSVNFEKKLKAFARAIAADDNLLKGELLLSLGDLNEEDFLIYLSRIKEFRNMRKENKLLSCHIHKENRKSLLRELVNFHLEEQDFVELVKEAVKFGPVSR